jgi:hypothetical protein
MDYKFGLCPHCKGSDGYLNIGAYHVFVCDLHMTYWQTTSHVLPWEHEDNAKWHANADKLEAYTEVQPVFNRRMAIYPVWPYGEVEAGR